MKGMILAATCALLTSAGCERSPSEVVHPPLERGFGIVIDGIRDAATGDPLVDIAVVTVVRLEPQGLSFPGYLPDSVTGNLGEARQVANNRSGRYRVRVNVPGYATWEAEVKVLELEPHTVMVPVILIINMHRTAAGE